MHRSAIDTAPAHAGCWTSAGCWVKGDPLRLVQIFSNLLDNATKFSPDGGQIHVAARRTGADRLAISIRDEGVGIDPSQIAKVFDTYQQGHLPQLERTHGVWAWDLTIVRGLVEQHGGTIMRAQRRARTRQRVHLHAAHLRSASDPECLARPRGPRRGRPVQRRIEPPLTEPMTAKDGEVVIQVVGFGPTGDTFVPKR